MTKVAILPETNGTDGAAYRAIAGKLQSVGRTPGEALDGLTAQLGEEEAGTLVIVQSQRPDRFFSADQQQRLAQLMQQWRAARDAGTSLPPLAQRELEALTRAELEAATRRAQALIDELSG